MNDTTKLVIKTLLNKENPTSSDVILSSYIHLVFKGSSGIGELYFDNWNNVKAASGSRYKHHNWQGGYIDHILQMLFLLEVQIQNGFIHEYNRQYFAATILLHDIEKVFRYEPDFDKYASIYNAANKDNFGTGVGASVDEAPLFFNSEDEVLYRIIHDIKYAHGELKDHNPVTRVMTASGSFLHSFDILSARAYYNLTYLRFIAKFESILRISEDTV